MNPDGPGAIPGAPLPDPMGSHAPPWEINGFLRIINVSAGWLHPPGWTKTDPGGREWTPRMTLGGLFMGTHEGSMICMNFCNIT